MSVAYKSGPSETRKARLMPLTAAGSGPEPYLARDEPSGGITVLADASRTAGAMAVVTTVLSAGSSRSWMRFLDADLAYLVLDGAVEVHVGAQSWVAEPFSLFHCPRGTAHCLKASAASRVAVLATPAGVEGFLIACDTNDAALLLALAQEHRVEVLPDFLA